MINIVQNDENRTNVRALECHMARTNVRALEFHMARTPADVQTTMAEPVAKKSRTMVRRCSNVVAITTHIYKNLKF